MLLAGRTDRQTDRLPATAEPSGWLLPLGPPWLPNDASRFPLAARVESWKFSLAANELGNVAPGGRAEQGTRGRATGPIATPAAPGGAGRGGGSVGTPFPNPLDFFWRWGVGGGFF